ncbi:methyl-accepting chemotaxis protein [Leptolyngbya sp. Heron Island J]|uniref:methyl-accepting chemotaxis protein n=1 Tax=Leptolyngbya sp. Heron Island J TaxID=1385935 RepID=UPI0003B9B6E7|nr:methyl-accepting chemotaxis protein [Leptolyngbya sp. Heron Island J]ESA35454.1 methyl-accepting chemotaxis protein [Leptolyngbya sp. Heron Island J]
MTLSTSQHPDSNGNVPSQEAVAFQSDELSASLAPNSLSEAAVQLPWQHQSSVRQGTLKTWWQRIGLRAKASVLAMLLGTLPVVGVGAIAYNVANQGTLEKLAELERIRANDLQSAVERFMQDRYSDINFLANLELFIDPKLRNTVTAQQKSELLDQMMQAYNGVYSSIAFFDLQGNPVAQTSQGQKLSNHLQRSYIQAAKVANGAILSQPSISKTSGEFSIYSASVVKDKMTGQPVGYVRARIPVEALKATLDNFGDIENEFYLANESGTIFLSTESAYTIPINSAGQPVDISESVDIQVLTLADIFPDISGIVQGDSSQTVKTKNTLTDNYEIAAFTPFIHVDGLPDLNWSVVKSVDLALVATTQRRLFFAIALGTLAAAGIATGLAIWATRRFTQPILQAANIVTQIGQGDLHTRLEVTGQDEIAQLGNNINQMAEQLKQFNNEQQTTAQQSKLLAAATSMNGDPGSEHNQAQLNLFVEQVRTFLQADRVVLYRIEGAQVIGQNESITINQTSVLDEAVPTLLISQTEIENYTNGQLLIADDIATADLVDSLRNRWQTLQVKSALVVPIMGQGRLFGLLTIHHVKSLHIWAAAEIGFCTQLGHQLGVLMTVQQFSSLASEQKALKENLQKRALELMLEVDPVSQGDLTVRAQVTADEIGTIADSYNATIASLKKIVGQVQQASQQVTTTANQNESSVLDLSQAAQQQTQEIAAALDQLAQMVTSIREVAANTDQAKAIVKQTTATVTSSDEAMNRTVEGILAIRETVAATAKKVKRLGESSQKISGVVNLINEFAAQTNLLALNASIEAARAGEEGRGFAVVADEVRSLAQQSAEATTEIENLVAEIQAETNDVVKAMEMGTEQVVVGTQLVDETRESLNSIAQVTTDMKILVNSINQATLSQSENSESVTKVMKGVANIAQKTSSNANKVSTSFKELLEISQALQESVSQFKVS